MAKPKYTKAQFDAEYPDDGACLDEIMRMRHGGTEIQCPGCKKQSKFHRITKRRAYACQWCAHHIFPCVGTIFEKSRTPLTKWFYAAYLLTATRHGVPARELERQLGVTFKCALRISHALRRLMIMADDKGPLGGPGKHIEADGTLIGGRDVGGPRGSRRNKSSVTAVVERGGSIRVDVIPSETTEHLEGQIARNVKPGSLLSTDEHPGYARLRQAGYLHRTVKEWVRGRVHTNTIEGYWSHLKHSIRGTHIRVDPEHLWKYVGEFSYRYNMRKQQQEMFNRMILAVALPCLKDP